MLTIAGREAGIVGISPLRGNATGFDHFAPTMATSGGRIEEQLSWISQAAGNRFEDLELSVLAHHLEVTDDIAATAEARAAAWDASPQQVLPSPHVFLGRPEEMIETLQVRRERYGISYVVFPAAEFEVVEQIVSKLAGT